MSEPRLLLLEFYFPDRYSQFRSRNFPFLLGQARALGVAADWLHCHMPPGQDSRQRYVIHLAAAERAALLDAIEAARPSHLLLAEKLDPDLDAALRARLPGALIENLAEAPLERLMAWPRDWLPGWLGRADAGGAQYLVDAVEPAYACRSVCRPPGAAAPPVHASAGVDCTYRRALARNPAFAGVELPAGVRPFGCSFCVGPWELAHRFATPAVELALRQCRAAAGCAHSCLARDRYVISGARVFARIGAFLDGILESDFPPSRFFFGCRLDELLARADAIERRLPALARAGHSVNIFNMGLENCSPAENQRLNKGLDFDTVRRGDRLLRRLEAEYADSFSFSSWGGWGLILFTPWTAVDDLALNLERLGELGGIDSQGFALTSKLQILSESAVRCLAERDGLLAADFADFHYYDSGCIFRHDQRELPWRFARPEVAALYAIAWRIAPITPVAADDPLFERIQDQFARLAATGGQPFDYFRLALDAVRREPALVEPQAILDRVAGHLPSAEAAAAEQRQRQRARPAGADALLSESPASRRALALLRALAAADALRGYAPQSVAAKPEGQAGAELVLELARGGQRLVLHLLEKRPGVPAFLATERFLLRYNEATPVADDDALQVARLVAANLELQGLALAADAAAEAAAGEPAPLLDAQRVAALVGPARGKEALPE
jgi:hypothetical protein